MSIEFACKCGKTLKAPDGSGGRRAKCPRCGEIVTVPQGQTGDSLLIPLNPAPQAAPPSSPRPQQALRPSPAPDPIPALTARPLHEYPTRPHRTFRSFTYLFLILALIPLFMSTFQKESEEDDPLTRTLIAHPEIQPAVKQVLESDNSTIDDLYAALPGHRMEGAMLAHESKVHWLMALAAAVGFFALLLFAFSNALKYAKGLIFAGIFTGNVGILLLLAFQWAAYSLPWVIPRGIISLVLFIIKLIGASYSLAHSEYGFIPSFLGFTCGVGLCEEVTKAIPLLFRIRSVPGEEEATWNTMLIWGLASGIGFGIAEGIMYSGRYYNGALGPGIYYVRFISCVLLHAMWAGAVGITMYNRQSWLENAENGWMYCFYVVLIVLVPMILHGLYDTLLAQSHEAWALVVAVASFGWLMFQIERMWHKPPEIVTEY